MSLDEYRDLINRLIDEMSGEIELNGSHEHASVIVDCMLSRAKSSVRILSRTFDPRIYAIPDLVSSAKRFLADPKRTCRILLEDVTPSSMQHHDFLLLGKDFANLDVRVVHDKLKEPIAIGFSLMDSDGLRFEKDYTESSAFVAFGEKALTKKLDALFESIWELSKPLLKVEVAA